MDYSKIVNTHGRSITPCKHSSEEFVNKAAYIPTKARVEMYMQAGRRLKDVMEKISLGDYDEEDLDYQDDAFDKSLDPDYDISDAHQDELRLRAEIKDTITKSSKKAEESSKSDTKTFSGQSPKKSPPAGQGELDEDDRL